MDRLLDALPSSPHSAFGFGARAKLEAGLVALIAGLVMGRRNPNAIAQSFALDPLWTGMVGRRFIQRELSRLMEVLSDRGEGALRRALLESAQVGQDDLELDMDSSLLELHGTQEKGSYNGHYHAYGYHAGWALDLRTDRIAALWLNEGKAHTATGQAGQLTWILDQGARATLARFDAGLIGPDLLRAIEGRVDRFVCRIRPNENLERLADPLEPPMPLFAGARSYAEFSYGAETWEAPQRVVVRFYQQRGESERVFGEFVTTLQPTFRHAEVRKNAAWALLVALAHNVLADLRDQLPIAEKPARPRVEHHPDVLPDGWVYGFHRLQDGATQAVSPLLARVRDLALRVPCALRIVGMKFVLYIQPDLLAPNWFPALARN